MTTVKSTMKKSVKKAPVKKEPIKKSVKQPSPETVSAPKILAALKCRTLSDKSELTYNIALDDEQNILLRINGNTGGGYWSSEYVSFDAITSALEEAPKDRPITSIHLFKIFKGKSSNTPGFLLAILLTEGLLVPFQGKKRQYAYSDEGTEAFTAKIEKLKKTKA